MKEKKKSWIDLGSNWMIPVLVLIVLCTWFYLDTTHRLEILTLESKHQAEIQKVKSETLASGPLDFDKYFESGAFVVDYVKNVNPNISDSDAVRFVQAIKVTSRKYPRVNPARLLFTAEIESTFRSKVKSGTGAVGIMGIQPEIWLKKYSPKNERNLSAVGIETVDQLKTIEGSVEASAWILNAYAEDCENLEKNEPGTFKVRYQNISECTSEKYLGGSYGFYHTRLKRSAGNFWFWMVERASEENNKNEEKK